MQEIFRAVSPAFTVSRESLKSEPQQADDLNSFLEDGAVALHLVRADGTVLRASKAELDLLGYAREEYVGQNIAKFHADAHTVDDILARLKRGERLDKYPAQLLTKNADIKHVLITSSAQFRDGDFINTRCFTIDVTKQKAAEDLVREQEQRLDATYNHAHIGIAEADATGRHLRVNEALCAITGYRAEEMHERTFFDNTHPDDREPDRRLYAQMIAGELDRYTVEKRYVRKNGEHVWVKINASSVRDANGRFRYGIRVVQDIDDQKRAGDARQRLAAIVESSDDAIVSKDLNGVIVTWNKGAERIFGYTAQEIIGKPVTVLIPEARHDEETTILRQIRSGERIEHYETVRRRKDGNLVDISLTVSPIKNDKGEIIGASKIARDISDRKQAEAQRDLLVAELSHRVKNTLATVISIARQSFANPNTDEARLTFDARIRALARTHTRLAESNWSGVSLATILKDELEPYRDGDGANVHIAGPAIALSPRCALTIGLVIHELATNAAKHGAFSTTAGAIEVNWTLDPADGTLCLNWREMGGPPVAPPLRYGFGRLLFERALPSDLNGRVVVDFAPQGLRCAIAIPSVEYTARH